MCQIRFSLRSMDFIDKSINWILFLIPIFPFRIKPRNRHRLDLASQISLLNGTMYIYFSIKNLKYNFISIFCVQTKTIYMHHCWVAFYKIRMQSFELAIVGQKKTVIFVLVGIFLMLWCYYCNISKIAYFIVKMLIIFNKYGN